MFGLVYPATMDARLRGNDYAGVQFLLPASCFQAVAVPEP
jgi:hypothetical protein